MRKRNTAALLMAVGLGAAALLAVAPSAQADVSQPDVSQVDVSQVDVSQVDTSTDAVGEADVSQTDAVVAQSVTALATKPAQNITQPYTFSKHATESAVSACLFLDGRGTIKYTMQDKQNSLGVWYRVYTKLKINPARLQVSTKTKCKGGVAKKMHDAQMSENIAQTVCSWSGGLSVQYPFILGASVNTPDCKGIQVGQLSASFTSSKTFYYIGQDNAWISYPKKTYVRYLQGEPTSPPCFRFVGNATVSDGTGASGIGTSRKLCANH